MDKIVHLNERDQVVIPVGLEKEVLKKQLQSMVKLAPKESKWKTALSANVSETFEGVVSGVGDLLNSDQGTSIPYISSVTGNFLVNPCPVSMSTFNKMVQTDEVISRCVSQNINSIIQGIGEYHHSIPECEKIGREAIKRLEGGIGSIVETVAGASMVNGMYAGFIDKESMYYTDEGYVFPTKIDHMPEITVQFSADNKGRVDNIYQYVYNFPYAGTQNALSTMGFMPGDYNGSIGVMSIDRLASLGPMDYPFRTNFIQNFGLVELDKRFVVHYAMEGHQKGINPYGTSWLLPVYNTWIMKQLSKELYISAQSRSAHPLLVGYASHTAKIQVGESASEVVGAVEALYEAMKDHSEDSALILTGLKGQVMEIEAIHNEGNFNVFENALAYYDKGIETGLKVPGGSYESGNSFAGVTAQSSLYMRNMSKYRKDIVREVILNQYMRIVLQTNYDSEINNFGEFDIDIIDIDDRLKYVKLYSQMHQDGFISNLCPDTVRLVQKQMGLPESDDEEMELLLKENLYKLSTGLGTGGNSHDTSKKKDVAESSDHYKSQSQENRYNEAKGEPK